MLFFLFGKDDYQSKQKLREIIENYEKIHKSGLNLNYFEGKDLSFQKFKDSFHQSSMFREKKLIVLKNIFSNQEFKEKFIENYSNFSNSKDLILFYEGKDVLKGDVFYKFLKKNAKNQEFKLLSGQKLINWVDKEFQKYGIKITHSAKEEFIKRVGNNLWQTSNEIKKLASYKKNRLVEIGDIKLLINEKIETNIFKTIDCLAIKNRKDAILLLRKHLESGDAPVYLLSMIAFQFRNLLIIKSSQFTGFQDTQTLSRRSGIHPFVIRKSLSQARGFSFEELKKIFKKIFKTDIGIKTGQIKAEIALDSLIIEI